MGARMTTLSGPVGIRNGVAQVQNSPVDQGRIIRLLWAIDPGNAGMKGISNPPAAGGPRRCNAELAGAIAAFQAFWTQRGDLTVADGVVDPGGRTLRKLDALANGAGPAPAPPIDPGFIDLNILRFQQTLPGTAAALDAPAIVPSSVIPFLFRPVPKGAILSSTNVKGTISEFRFKIEKNGAIFWVGAAVPAGTIDFSRVYIFFHPDTISVADDASYPTFSGRWRDSVTNYVWELGVQMAAMKAMPVIVPFMTNASRSNNPRTNLFADRGADTLDDIMTAIQISVGQANPRGAVRQVGVASYSSGVNHLFRFAEVVGGTGLIGEQIDFDSAYMRSAHKNMPSLSGVVNWMVTQSPPPPGRRIGWLHLPHEAFRNVHNGKMDTHGKIGNMMFHSMMMLSVIL